MMALASDSRVTYAELPGFYWSAIQRGLVDRLHQRTGRVFEARCPDVYSSFAVAHLVGARLNAEAGYRPHPRVPDLPSVMAALVAEAFQHARDTWFPDDAALTLDRKAVVRRCAAEAAPGGAADGRALRGGIRTALEDEPGLVAWLDAEYPDAAAPASAPAPPALRRYGGAYLYLDASEFGVSDVYGAAELCEGLHGFRKDGVNARVEPCPAPPPEPPTGWHGVLRRVGTLLGRRPSGVGQAGG